VNASEAAVETLEASESCYIILTDLEMRTQSTRNQGVGEAPDAGYKPQDGNPSFLMWKLAAGSSSGSNSGVVVVVAVVVAVVAVKVNIVYVVIIIVVLNQP
jgi:hypothetical protein